MTSSKALGAAAATDLLTRRRFVAATLAGAVGGIGASTSVLPATAAAAAGRPHPVSMAMHLHAVYSEGPASMQAHLEQAAAARVDVLWWTDHDLRMLAHRYRRAVRFDGWTEDEDGLAWTWSQSLDGAPEQVRTQWVTAPVSGRDGGGRALTLRATGPGGVWSRVRMVGAAQRMLIRTGIADQTLELDVLPRAVGPDACLDLVIGLSYRPALGGRPAGRYRISYRIGGDQPPGSAVADGLDGVVTVATAPTGWTRLRTDLLPDLNRLWPDLVAADNSTYEVEVVLSARRGATADVTVDALRFHRSARTAAAVTARRAQIAALLAPRYPGVAQHHGVELSLYDQHLNWFGPRLELPDLAGIPLSGLPGEAALTGAVRHVHGQGGLASFNHPFGGGSQALRPEPERAGQRRGVAATLLANHGFGVDILEVGYGRTNGMGLADHVDLWDTLSAHGLFLTGTGVTDDHTGRSWLDRTSNHLTWVWARDTSMGELLTALAAGRAWFGDPTLCRGAVDLLVDGAVPMGAVSASTASRRLVRVIATDLPGGGRVELVRGLVDRIGAPADPPSDPRTQVICSVPAPRAGYVDVDVDTRTECFVRPVIRAASGAVAALGNPVWLLRSLPAGVPPARRA